MIKEKRVHPKSKDSDGPKSKKAKTSESSEPSEQPKSKKNVSFQTGDKTKKSTKPKGDKQDGKPGFANKFKGKNFQNKKPALNQKPTDWNEFKKEKKKLRENRKQNKNFFDVIVEAKKISENLRKKTLKGGDEERNQLTATLHEMLGNKNMYVKLVMAHDMARVVQYLLKFGTPKIREEIAEELIPATLELIQSKYAKFCVERMLKYGSPATRSRVIQACYGSVVKLSSHSVSAHVLANAYSTWATPKERQNLQQEFYGDMYKKSKDDSVHSLADTYKNSPDMKAACLSSVKANLNRILNKELLNNQLVHTVIADYFQELSDANEKAELITSLASHCVILANTEEGSRVVMNCIWHGNNKDKKVLLKALKVHVKDLSCHEHGHTTIITVLDAVDDTVLVNKILLSELLNHITDLVQNEWGRKVLLWLVAPGDTHYFHPHFIQKLKKGLESSTSKKDPEQRAKEHLNNSIQILLKGIETDPSLWLKNGSTAMVSLAILKSASNNEQIKPALENISTLISDPSWTIVDKPDDKNSLEMKSTPGIEHPGLNMMLKKLAMNDKNVTEENLLFSQTLLNQISDEGIRHWISTNRGCFLFVTMFESSPEKIQKKISKSLKKYVKELQKQNTKGAEILLKKIM